MIQQREETLIAQHSLQSKEARLEELQVLVCELRSINERLQKDNKIVAQQSIAHIDDVTRLKKEVSNLLADRDLLCQHDNNTQENLRCMMKMYEKEVENHNLTGHVVGDVRLENESLYDRILELEVELKQSRDAFESNVAEFGDVGLIKAQLARKDSELRDCQRSNEDMRLTLGQLQAQRNDEFIAAKRQQKRLATLLSESNSDCEHFRVLSHDLKSQVSALKSQKRILVSELRTLRDMGLYENPVSEAALSLKRDEAIAGREDSIS